MKKFLKTLTIIAASLMLGTSCEQLGIEMPNDDQTEQEGNDSNENNKDEQKPDEGEVAELHGSISYDINGGGTTSYSLAGGGELSVVINQTSTYAKEDGTVVYTSEPKATIKLKTNSETVEVDDSSLLEDLAQVGDVASEVDGDNPLTYIVAKSFKSCNQIFDFEIAYEVYTSEGGDEMPYLKIGEPACVGIEVNPVDATKAVEITNYDVKARFEVEIVGVNVSEPISKTLEFEVTYLGCVSVLVDDPVQLVDVKYRKEIILTPAHHNLPHSFRTIVYRDRYYSDNHVETDTFTGLNYMCFHSRPGILDASACVLPADTLVTFANDYQVYYRTSNHDLYFAVDRYDTGSCVVPSLDDLELTIPKTNQKYFKDFVVGFDSRYNKDLSNETFNPDDPDEGWYICGVADRRNYTLTSPLCDYDIIRRYEFEWLYDDRFLYIDGQIIDFPECRPKYENGGPVLTTIDLPETEEYGPGRIYRFDLKGEVLGQKFHHYIVDTVYTFKR